MFPQTGFSPVDLFKMLMAGLMDAWVIERSDGAVCAIATTQWLNDAVGGQKHLAVFSLFGGVPIPALQSAIVSLTKCAGAKGATHVSIHTRNADIIGMAQAMGGNLFLWYIVLA